MPLSKTPPGLPDVYDEAGDSPSWLPALGLGLLALLALVFAARFVADRHVPPTATPATQFDGDSAEPAGANAALPPSS